jgi:hypothetical protein
VSDPARSPTPIRTFDPAQHLSRVNGNDYMEVKWSLVWFRERYPDGQVETEMVDRGPDWVIFKAKVTAIGEDGVLCGSATGHSYGAADEFRDYIEKAETAAIGRALRSLGFGPVFALDLEAGARPANPAAPTRKDAPADQPRRNRADGPEPMSPRQQRYLEQVAQEAGVDAAALEVLAMRNVGVPYRELPRAAASSLITYLQALAARAKP